MVLSSCWSVSIDSTTQNSRSSVITPAVQFVVALHLYLYSWTAKRARVESSPCCSLSSQLLYGARISSAQAQSQARNMHDRLHIDNTKDAPSNPSRSTPSIPSTTTSASITRYISSQCQTQPSQLHKSTQPIKTTHSKNIPDTRTRHLHRDTYGMHVLAATDTLYRSGT